MTRMFFDVNVISADKGLIIIMYLVDVDTKGVFN